MADFFKGGRGFGGVASTLIANDMDPNALRPFVGQDGRSYVVKTTPGGIKKAVLSANEGVLRHEEWRTIDEAVVRVAKPAMAAVSDLRSRGLTMTVDGMSTIILSYETVSDLTGATTSMDGMRQTEKDRPVYDIANLPIPIIHKDLSFSARQIAETRKRGMPLDTTAITLATRRVAEEAEKLLIGSSTNSFYYGGGTVYGYTNFPGRQIKTITLPTAVGWTPQSLVDDLLDMKQNLVNAYHPGPYMLYVSSGWEKYLDADYSSAYNGNTLRSRIQQIGNIQEIKTLNYLNPDYQMILVQMTEDVIQLVVGMDIRVVQWESAGGMEVNFKIMCILVPRMKQDQNSNAGLSHATAA